MNFLSRIDELPQHEGSNQNPSALAADLTTREDLNGTVNRRAIQDSNTEAEDTRTVMNPDISKMGGEDPRSTDHAVQNDTTGKDLIENDHSQERSRSTWPSPRRSRRPSALLDFLESFPAPRLPSTSDSSSSNRDGSPRRRRGRRATPNVDVIPESRSSSLAPTILDTIETRKPNYFRKAGGIIAKFFGFVGPGFMVAVAYIDPGNYSTDVAAGVATKFKLLFIVLMSNLFAIVLQTLAIRLGTVTGLNLAEHCRAHLKPWLNIPLYVLGEAAIISTDIAEVIGSAIALNLLTTVPLAWGCLITLIDVVVILFFYNPRSGSLSRLKYFEYFVIALVLGVVVCFCVELSFIHRHSNASAGEVFKGYLPSSAVVDGQGLYLSCGILGATVMPHSLYLGSGMVQPRLLDFDTKAGNDVPDPTAADCSDKVVYRPSLAAINSCLRYSVVETVMALFTFALFVNSAILIVAGASLSSDSAAEEADLFGIYHLLKNTLSTVAATTFALALLLSGTSAGIVCTIAGQMLSEGALNWKLPPLMRRLLTRSISIVPAMIVAASVGKDGLTKALNATQVSLSIALPFISAPLVYFTCRNKYMMVGGANSMAETDDDQEPEIHQDREDSARKMRNPWYLSVLAVLIWLVICIMNVALLVILFMGRG